MHVALRFPLWVGLVLAVPTIARAADSQERAVCIDAAARAQSRLDAHQLLAARSELLICARSVCPAPVLKDCVAWFNQVTAETPALLLLAKDETGAMLMDVSVSIDGVVVARRLDGVPIPVDPGVHEIVFESKNGVKAEQHVLAQLGGARTEVTATLLSPRPEAVAPAVPLAVSSGASDAIELPSPPQPASPRAFTVRTAGAIALAVGAAGMVVGGAFGIDAIAKLHQANCEGNVCQDLSALHAGSSAATVADVGLISGGALAALGGLSPPARATCTDGISWSIPRATPGGDDIRGGARAARRLLTLSPPE